MKMSLHVYLHKFTFLYMHKQRKERELELNEQLMSGISLLFFPSLLHLKANLSMEMMKQPANGLFLVVDIDGLKAIENDKFLFLTKAGLYRWPSKL